VKSTDYESPGYLILSSLP